jgi:hypothetical protein
MSGQRGMGWYGVRASHPIAVKHCGMYQVGTTNVRNSLEKALNVLAPLFTVALNRPEVSSP